MVNEIIWEDDEKKKVLLEDEVEELMVEKDEENEDIWSDVDVNTTLTSPQAQKKKRKRRMKHKSKTNKVGNGEQNSVVTSTINLTENPSIIDMAVCPPAAAKKSAIKKATSNKTVGQIEEKKRRY